MAFQSVSGSRAIRAGLCCAQCGVLEVSSRDYWSGLFTYVCNTASSSMALRLRFAKIQTGIVVLGRMSVFYGVAQVPEPPSSQSQAFGAFCDILDILLVYLKQKRKEIWKPTSLIFLPTSPMCTGVILGEMSVKICRCRRK